MKKTTSQFIHCIIACILINLLGTDIRGQVKPNSAITQVPTLSGTMFPSPEYNPIGSPVKVNYVKARQARGPQNSESSFASAGFSSAREMVSYVDGLGRPLQEVNRQATPGSSPKDLVKFHVYDAFSREPLQYIPYVHTTSEGNTNDGHLKQDAYFSSYNFYSGLSGDAQSGVKGEQVFFGKTEFETSPLGRVKKAMSPGNSWAGSNVGTEMQYQVNDANDSVRIWSIGYNTILDNNVPTSNDIYLPNQLFKTVTIDESGSKVVEYKDSEGKVILKKSQVNGESTAAYYGWLCTYYIYDDFGLLRFVIPPKAVEQLSETGWVVTANSTLVNELCFHYEYDSMNRMIAKKVPGSGWVYLVYDKRDRLVFSQDANMRSDTKWLYTLYDGLNRSVQTGMLLGYTGSRTDLQDYVNLHTGLGVSTAATTSGNSFVSFPADLSVNAWQSGHDYQATNTVTVEDGFESADGASYTIEIISTGSAGVFTTTTAIIDNPIPDGFATTPLTLNFYDNYTQTGKSFSSSYNSRLNDYGSNTYPESILTSMSALTSGMPTISRVRVMDNPANLSEGKWLESVNFYDDKGRTTQVQSDNYKGGIDIITTRYSFTGQPIGLVQAQNNPAANTSLIVQSYMDYDHADRLLQVRKKLNDATIKTLKQLSYNDLGQLITKKLGEDPSTENPIETLDFAYNIRGWLQGINRDFSRGGSGERWFGMELNYDWGFTTNQTNGNIAGTQWRTKGDEERRAYGYSYDRVNRLLSGDFTQYTSSSWNVTAGLDFSMKMGDGSNYNTAYDANGNIKAMFQKGWKVGGSSPIDDLVYNYIPGTNKLLNVVDAENNAQTTLGDFRSSQTYLTALGGTKSSTATDYTYDDNGNLNQDKNKDINTISYNHLNLPYQIAIPGKGTITYIYDANGNKLEKRTEETGQPVKNTTYIQGSVYENNVLQFVSHEEGRIRNVVSPVNSSSSFEFDYFIKDHLGNTRMVLTEEREQQIYPAATLESSAVSVEGQFYTINSGAIVDKLTGIADYQNRNGNPDPVNNNPTSVPTDNSLKVYKLNAASGDRIGLGITLKVMSGDNVNIFGKSYWHSNSTLDNSYPVSDVITNLLNVLGGSNAVATASHNGVNGSLLNGSSPVTSSVSGWVNNVPTPSSKPKAYINWILFDDQFKVVSNGSGFDGISDVADEVKSHLQTVNINHSGFLYVYCSNESNQNVYFDNLQLVHNKGALVEETHYYPFGLTMAGISSKAAGKLENRFKYNSGTELNNNLDLNWYETDFRSYDPQIGRFWQIDELTEFDLAWSPYVFAHNNPILLNDPLGLTADSTKVPGFENSKGGAKNELPEVVVTSTRKKSVGQPGMAESLIPVWGSARAAVDDFQNGRWGWGIFNSLMAVSDVFLVKSAITAIGKIAIKETVTSATKEGVYVITTRSGRYIGQSKNFLKRLIQHFGKGGKLSGEALEKALLHEMPGSSKLEREVYEQYLIDKNGLDNLINVVNPMGGRREVFSQMIDGVIEKFGLPK